MAGRLYALLVGIDAYAYPVRPLHGCGNDVRAMEAFLSARAGGAQIRTLRDAAATRQGVIAAFREHLGAARAGDTALFYFSGHGSREPTPPELAAIEPDLLNETLVCVDSREPDGRDLADKELGKLVAEVAQGGAHVVVVLDSCHSGTATRALDDTVRRAPADPRPRSLDTMILDAGDAAALTRTAGHAGGWSTGAGRHVLLAACRAEEEAKEHPLGGERRGVFSYFLLQRLQQAAETPTYRDLHREVTALVRSQAVAQWPDVEATHAPDIDQPFLGGAVPDRPRHFALVRDPELGWVLDAGAVHGIPPIAGAETTTLAVYEALVGGKPLATARVTELRPTVSRVDVDAPLDTGRAYPAVVLGLPLPPTTACFEGDPGGVERLREALARAGPEGGASLYVAEAAAGAEADVTVEATGHGFQVLRASDRRPVTSQDGMGAAEADEIVDRLEHIARWTRLADLRNPLSGLPDGAVALDAFVCDPDDPDKLTPLETDHGELVLSYLRPDGRTSEPQMKVRLRNRSDRTLYCVLLDLTETYGVFVNLLPAGGERLGPGEEVWAYGNRPIPVTIPDRLAERGFVELKDVLKLIASTEKIDATALHEDDLEVAAPTRSAVARRAPEIQSTLDRLMRRVAVRHVGAERAAESVADWTTTELGLTVQRPAASRPVPGAGERVALAAGVTLRGHPALRGGTASLTAAPQSARALDAPPLPAILLDDPAVSVPFELQQSRSGRPGPSVLHLEPPTAERVEAVTPQEPLVLDVEAPLAEEEHVLPFGWDGELWVPLGHARRAADGRTEIVLDRLTPPVPTPDARSVLGSVKIFLQKLAGEKLGAPYAYPMLAAASVEGDKVVYERDRDEVARRVRAADRILLYVHGIVGDTRAMAASAYGVRVRAADPPPVLADRYDVVLTFDYENINTRIEETARDLGERLAAVGLGPDHGKTLHVAAHSMGGLVARWFVEREGGSAVVQHIVMLGTPHAGSPWPKLQDWATTVAGFALNNLAAGFWPATVLPAVLALIEKADVTLDQLAPGSDLLTELAAAPDPAVAYTALAGNTSIRPDAGGEGGRVAKLLRRLRIPQLVHGGLGLAFFGQPNDIAVSVASAQDVPDARMPPADRIEVACDHLTYFSAAASVRQLAAALPPA